MRTSQCCVHDCMNVVNLLIDCRWLINANWFCVLFRLMTNFDASYDRCHLCWEWCSSRRVSSQDVVSSKIDEAAKARALEWEERSLRHSTSIRSTREFHENSWRYRSLNCKCTDVLWSTTLIFLDRRLEATDRAWYRWECVQCFRSFAQTSSRRHHNRSSFLDERKISRRRSESCLVRDRFRLEEEDCSRFEIWNEDEERDEENPEEKERRRRRRKKNENDEFNDDDERNDVEIRIVQIVVSKQFQVQISVIIDKRSFSRRIVKK